MIRKALLLFIFVFALSAAQYYDIAIVRADNNSAVQSLVYDDPSFSYKDNSMENPDMNIRVCALNAADLMNKYIALAYADGSDGDYIIVTHFPAHVTSVPPILCVYETLEISSFRAWYPSIPYVFISDSPSDFSAAERWKLSRLRGWFIGNYTLTENRTGALTTINVTDALDDSFATSIVPDLNYLVVGLVRDDFTTMDTGITSPGDPVTLNADSATAVYRIFINGIGPDLPPYVEIITPEPITYDTGTIPFTYIMYDDDDIASCWYILDGLRVDMPVCGPAYILNVGQGTHTLFLYANDTTGNIGSDSVTFQVGAVTPPSGGPPGTPYWPHVPPPIPPYFSTQENLYVTVDYPQEGITHFNLTSTVALYGISCFVKGDFEEYTTVEITDVIPANGTIFGTITVDMPPNDILDYDESDRGVMQCVGSVSETLTASTVANVFLVLHRPWFEPEEVTLDIFLGEEKEGIIPFLNVGEYNSSAINISIEFEGAYSPLVTLTDNTKAFQYDEMGLIYFIASIPEDFGIGLYRIPFTIYENGRPRGEGTLLLNVKQPPIYVCTVMDLLWTLLIILIGIIVSVYLFRRKLRENMEKMPVQERKEDKWKLYRKPLAYAVVTMLIAVAVWWIVASMFLKCL